MGSQPDGQCHCCHPATSQPQTSQRQGPSPGLSDWVCAQTFRMAVLGSPAPSHPVGSPSAQGHPEKPGTRAGTEPATLRLALPPAANWLPLCPLLQLTTGNLKLALRLLVLLPWAEKRQAGLPPLPICPPPRAPAARAWRCPDPPAHLGGAVSSPEALQCENCPEEPVLS